MLISDVIAAIEAFAAPSLQESWDNTGLQVGMPDRECTGVLVCLDPSPEAVEEAVARGCNLIVSHHPLFFRGVKSLTGRTHVETTALNAIAAGICIYSSHTASDSAPAGVSCILARKLGIEPARPLSPAHDASVPDAGLGIVGDCIEPLSPGEFVEMVKTRLGCNAVRTTKMNFAPDAKICRAAVCGGAGAEFIPAAIANGAVAYVTADVKHHDFVDYRDKILVIDAGHFETEAPIKQALAHVIAAKYPSLPVICTSNNENPINYI